uniref:Kinesin-like protein n=1 Tax=Macrostomum lignano TaxID=282301 RepID=A0A1I8IJC1_9PLAT
RKQMKSGGNRSKKVKVWVRVRPSQNFADDAIKLDPEGRSLQISVPRPGGDQQPQQRGFANNQRSDWSFRTDGIFSNSSQQEVYETVGADLIESGLAGYNGTIMCYGQTGAGKTFTITGATEMFHNRGLVPRALSHLYKEIEAKSDLAITVRITYLEIYNDTMLDLLATMPDSQEAGSPLVITEENGGVYVKGLNVHLAQSEEEALNLLFEGETNRATAAHALNKNSSRSHTIFTVYLETRSRFQSNSKYTTSKINFVDLAGSERLQKTLSTGKTQQEASYINKSLSFLEQTVIALTEKNRDHVPYRQSKLTHYLKDSIGGGCKTILIANIWGDVRQLDETVSTMRFAQRMSCVASEPVENQRTDPSIMVKVLEAEIAALKKELAMHNTLRFELRQQVQRYIDGDLDDIDLTSIRQIQAVFELNCWPPSRPGRVAATPPEGAARSLGPSTSGAQLGGEAVGDLDGRSFGIAARSEVGMDESGVFLQSKRREAAAATAASSKKQRQHPLGAGGGSSSGAAAGADSEGTLDAVGSSDPAAAAAARPGTPPSRTQAFEEFKKELGSEIYRILNENRTTMMDKKKEYSNLASQVNTTKTEIDRSRLRLDALKVEREAQGNLYTDEGELIINEEEFVEIKKLRQLKESYKADFDRLKELKTQIHYCQKMVDLTRQKLIQ